MQALVLHKGRLSLANRKIPKPDDNECLIEIIRAGICNTDLELIKGYMDFSGVPGHEFVGKVISAPVPELIGRRVVGEINIGCEQCEYCLRGRKEHCPHRSVLGILGKDGVFARYITLPQKNLYPVADCVPDDHAVLIEPLAAAIRIVQQIHLNPESNIAVLGDGKLGILIAHVLNAMSIYRFTLFGHHKNKLGLLKSRSIDKKLSIDEKDRHWFDYVIEATGTHAGFRQALELLKPQGVLVLKSTVAQSDSVNLAPVVINEIKVIGSRCGPFQPALTMLESGKIDLSGMISGIYPLENWQDAFCEARDKKSMKVLISP